ncbi:MAG: methylated-DNA--[protein]-cysteine S-methyltransferase [Bacteroidales bacterium]|nr:methylated-DNA--[protein]-cysteine S-methyltransferase [Bacteroidales bacterium]
MINITNIDTDLGLMLVAATDKGICLLKFTDSKHLDSDLENLAKTLNASLVEADNPLFQKLKTQLDEYFKVQRFKFDIPLDLHGTDFQKQVWQRLLQITYGKTISYAEQAKILGKESAVRAVANANGRNKIYILIPCHRVIGSNGKLTGYGGGVWRKKKLLQLEQPNALKAWK